MVMVQSPTATLNFFSYAFYDLGDKTSEQNASDEDMRKKKERGESYFAITITTIKLTVP